MFKIIFSAIILFSTTVFAMGIEEAKQKIQSARASKSVVETPTGYMKAVTQDSAIKEAVDIINSARKVDYEKLAKENKNKMTVEQIAAQMGAKLMEKYGN